MNENTIAQLHRTLVDAIRRTRPASLNRPVTVAEIYQDLVPYRTARAEVGFDMNADYEFALLRLLAGEGDLARIEPREVRDKLRMELDSPNPDVGMFRNYAACDVWVNVGEAAEEEPLDLNDLTLEGGSWEDEFLGEPRPDVQEIQAALQTEPWGDDDSDAAEPANSQPGAMPFEIAAKEPDEQIKPAPTREQPALITPPTCAFCASELPEGRMVNFCPFCGSDQSQQPCPTCGEMLEPLWRFCSSCGARARPVGDHLN